MPQPNTIRPSSTKTLQFQFTRCKSYRNLQSPKWFLWINRHAGNIPKNHRRDTKKLRQQIRIPR